MAFLNPFNWFNRITTPKKLARWIARKSRGRLPKSRLSKQMVEWIEDSTSFYARSSYPDGSSVESRKFKIDETEYVVQYDLKSGQTSLTQAPSDYYLVFWQC